MSAEPLEAAAPYAEVMPAEVVLHLPRYEAWTWDDLQVIPDEEHHHYELIEGQIVVSPSPNYPHQTIVLNLAVALKQAAPPELVTMVSPFDWVPEAITTLQPDVLVIRRGSAEKRRVIVPPVLVIEVLSRRTRTFDLTAKRSVYERFGVAHYWVVDPEAPSITALRLDENGTYAEVASVAGEDTFVAREPFLVDVVPSALMED
jgi:Uma2 family endonuclease